MQLYWYVFYNFQVNSHVKAMYKVSRGLDICWLLLRLLLLWLLVVFGLSLLLFLFFLFLLLLLFLLLFLVLLFLLFFLFLLLFLLLFLHLLLFFLVFLLLWQHHFWSNQLGLRHWRSRLFGVVLVLLLPGLRGVLVGSSESVQLSVSLHLLLLLCHWTQTPSSRVGVSLHDASLDLGNNTVVTRLQVHSGHLSNTNGDSFTLGGDQDNFVVQLNAVLVSQQTRNHQLGTVAHRVDSGILDNNTLVAHKQSFQRSDDFSQVRLVTGVVVDVSGIQDIVQSDHVVVFAHGTGSDTTQLLHVSTNSKQHTQVNTQGSHVCSGFTGGPENTQASLVVELNQVGVVDGSNTQSSLDSRNQRWSSEQSTSQVLQRTAHFLGVFQLLVQTHDTHVLFTGASSRFHQAGSSVHTNNQTSSDLRVQGTRVTGFFNTQDSLDPCNNLVRGWVRRLVQVDDTGRNVRLQVSFQRRGTGGDGRVVAGTNQQFIVVFQQKRPLRCVFGGRHRFWLDHVFRHC
ncbi:centromere/microtubule binding protein CBF5 [Clavispora lusitaniae ATCC 42720]|uniref:Centromere/microtubule binding protein CBF5 n=1 Tax=Clavispora lusitaniae (strain ATCC 42720) TaxID=306902 RepID=C4YAB9_CLAL4|nr:centromere/microtubule binding protein CBF5 [Clavispora lusitaniae ATCC 42720]EEQ40930.1 centromere/microtubule binding protein CBF5 [Clavispora lusitaniae ATCC 42720]